MIVILILVLVTGAGLLARRVGHDRAQRRAMAEDGVTGDLRGATAPADRGSRTKSDSHRLGYRYADDDIFINGNGVYAGVVLATQTDEYATRSERADMALQPASMAQSLVQLFDGKPVECHELVRYRPITTHGWARHLLELCWHPTELYRVLLGRAADYIATSTPQRTWFFIVRLGTLPPHRTIDPTAGITDAVLGVQQERLTEQDLVPWWDKAAAFHHLMTAYRGEPLSRQDLLWLIRKPGAGHLVVPDEPINHQRPWRDGWFELAAQLRGRNLGGGYLRLQHRNPETGQEATSYTATLVVADAPGRAVFNPRNPWGQRLAKLANPPEISWRYTLLGSEDFKRVTTKAAANIRDEEKDRGKAGAPTDSRFAARLQQAKDIEDSAEEPPPGMVGRLRLSVSAPTPKALAAAILDVKRAMGEIQVEVPSHAALPLLQEQLPGEAGVGLGSLSAGRSGGIRLWERYTDLYAPSVALLGSHPQIGDRVVTDRGRDLGWLGHPIGWVKGNGSVVHTDPVAQLARGEGAGVGIFGRSGGGKTSLALLQFFWMSESGVACSALDPKIDFANFVYYLSFGPQVLDPQFMRDADAGLLGTPASQFQPVNQAFWDETEIHDLARGPRGAQDPWRITETFQAGYSLAETLLEVLFNDPGHRRIARSGLRTLYTEHQAATAAGQPYRCGLGDLVEPLHADHEQLLADLEQARARGGDTTGIRAAVQDVAEVLDRIRTGQDTPFLRLMLGRRDDPPPAEHRLRRRTIYTLSGWRAPDHPDEPEKWTSADRNASAVMLAVLTRIRRDNLHGRLESNPVTGQVAVRPTATFCDEAYMITSIPPGRAHLTVNLRQGRSYRSLLFFMDQQARGIQQIENEARKGGGGEVNQFGTVFCFNQKTLGEAVSSLRLLRSVTEDEIEDDQREEALLARKLLSQDLGGELSAGVCAMRDPDSRVATVKIDQIFWPLQCASQTNAVLKPVDWANPVPTDPNQWLINPEALDSVRRGGRGSDLPQQLDDGEDDELTDAPGLAVTSR